jgi:hypothetical protein
VDYTVAAAKLRSERLKEPIDCDRISNVSVNNPNERSLELLGKLLFGFDEAGSRARAEHHLGAAAKTRAGCFESNSQAATRDENRLALKLDHGIHTC